MKLRNLFALAAVAAMLPLAGPALAQASAPEGPTGPFFMIERSIDDNGSDPRVFAQRFPQDPIEIPLHAGAAKRAGFAPGPVASVASGMNAGNGAALVAPAGGSFVTPRMKADRAIRRAIEKLD